MESDWWVLPFVEVLGVVSTDGPIGDSVDQIYSVFDGDITLEITIWVYDREISLYLRRDGWEQPLVCVRPSRVVLVRMLDDPGQKFLRIVCESAEQTISIEIATQPHVTVRVHPGGDND